MPRLSTVQTSIRKLRENVASLLEPDSSLELEAAGHAVLRLERAPFDHGGESIEIDGDQWAFQVPSNTTGNTVGRGGRFTLVVPRDLSYSRVVQLPQSAARHLPAVMAVQLSGISPVATDIFVGGCRILEGDPATDTVQGEQILIRKDIVNRLVAAAKAQGYRVEAVAAGSEEGGLPPVALHPDGQPFVRKRHRSWLTFAGLGIVALLLSYLGLQAAVSWQASMTAAELDAEQQILETKAKAVKDRLAARKRASESLATLISWQQSNAAVLSSLEELSHVLPDDAYVDAITIEGQSIAIDGQAAKAEDLIKLIESSSGLSAASFAAPVYRSPGEDKARFSIRAIIDRASDLKPAP